MLVPEHTEFGEISAAVHPLWPGIGQLIAFGRLRVDFSYIWPTSAGIDRIRQPRSDCVRIGGPAADSAEQAARDPMGIFAAARAFWMPVFHGPMGGEDGIADEATQWVAP